jgi:hypothetical protein
MILAWVFFASIGLLMTKYYKPMWPNSRMFDQRYWFVVSALSSFLYSVVYFYVHCFMFCKYGGLFWWYGDMNFHW